MGLSITHLILIGIVVALIFGPKPYQKLGKGVGDFWKGLKRGLDGKEDIEIKAAHFEEIDESKKS